MLDADMDLGCTEVAQAGDQPRTASVAVVPDAGRQWGPGVSWVCQCVSA